ncbi:hypothetical protein LIT38_15775 [Bacillus sp. CMF12]|uniref:hypothetical protein n=1 Tax=Bacillus sp. CMF12 TaxID=2884834 RepID=UPI00207981E2|nr:hypothetical protein [Bacillus sp. CMF12]USK48031.1 hypothetical protein LIT38_15775 [Bacillus sp. CMF12]
MSNTLDQLLDKGVRLKRSGNLEGARDCYIDAIKIDPYNMMTYISLGKTAHLLKLQGLAVRSYLAAAHLQLAPIEKGINENNLPIHLRAQYDSFPKEILASLPSNSAFTIYIDPNTPRHIAHSVIDLTPSTVRDNPKLIPYAEIYHAHILGDGTHATVLNKYGLTQSDQINQDEQVYMPFGRNFMIQELQWDKLDRQDVANFYFT